MYFVSPACNFCTCTKQNNEHELLLITLRQNLMHENMDANVLQCLQIERFLICSEVVIALESIRQWLR